MMRVQVRGKVPGGGGEGLPDVLVDLAAEVTTARELIRLAVTEPVRALRGCRPPRHCEPPDAISQEP